MEKTMPPCKHDNTTTYSTLLSSSSSSRSRPGSRSRPIRPGDRTVSVSVSVSIDPQVQKVQESTALFGSKSSVAGLALALGPAYYKYHHLTHTPHYRTTIGTTPSINRSRTTSSMLQLPQNTQDLHLIHGMNNNDTTGTTSTEALPSNMNINLDASATCTRSSPSHSHSPTPTSTSARTAGSASASTSAHAPQAQAQAQASLSMRSAAPTSTALTTTATATSRSLSPLLALQHQLHLQQELGMRLHHQRQHHHHAQQRQHLQQQQHQQHLQLRLHQYQQQQHHQQHQHQQQLAMANTQVHVHTPSQTQSQSQPLPQQPPKKRHKAISDFMNGGGQGNFGYAAGALRQQTLASPGSFSYQTQSRAAGPSPPPLPPSPLSEPSTRRSTSSQVVVTTSSSPINDKPPSPTAHLLKWEVDYIPLMVSDQHNNNNNINNALVTGGSVQTTEVCREINLADFINNKAARSNKKWKSDPSKRVYLPRQFNINTPLYRRTVLSPVVAQACAQAGFGITMKGWEKGLQAIRFVCNRNRKGCGTGTTARANGKEKNKDKDKETAIKSKSTSTSGSATAKMNTSSKSTQNGLPSSTTNGKTCRGSASKSSPSPTPEFQGNGNGTLDNDKGSKDGNKKRNRYVPPRIRPTSTEEVCPFSFYIYWEAASTVSTSSKQEESTQQVDTNKQDGAGRWFIVNNGAGCCVHMGHARKPPSEIRIRRSNGGNTNGNLDEDINNNGDTHPTKRTTMTTIPPTSTSSSTIVGPPPRKRSRRELVKEGEDVGKESRHLQRPTAASSSPITRASPTTITSTSLSVVASSSKKTSDDTLSDSEGDDGDEDSNSHVTSAGSRTLKTLPRAIASQSQTDSLEHNATPSNGLTIQHHENGPARSSLPPPPHETIVNQVLSPQQRQRTSAMDGRQMIVPPPMTQGERLELQHRLVQCGAFELLMPLYQELTCLVATDPDRANYAVSQLQDIAEHLRHRGLS